jgi:small subunit ribosomal protein S7
MTKPVKSRIPEQSSPIIEKFINCMMLKGKKNTTRRIFWDAIAIIKTRTKEEPIDVFNKALLNAMPLMEVRPKRIGGAVYQVPVEVSPVRQQALSIRWIVGATRDRKGAPMAQKLALELMEASAGQGAAIKKKEDTLRMAQANKAFAHLAATKK